MLIFILRDKSLVLHKRCFRLPNAVLALPILEWISLSIFPSDVTVDPRYLNVSTIFNAFPSMKTDGFTRRGLQAASWYSSSVFLY